uniref:Uncharacterized protein n=1 Tax=Romanomermis culicivorax TaxID=13658 RepID=A0A915J3B0_ROMCU
MDDLDLLFQFEGEDCEEEDDDIGRFAHLEGKLIPFQSVEGFKKVVNAEDSVAGESLSRSKSSSSIPGEKIGICNNKRIKYDY